MGLYDTYKTDKAKEKEGITIEFQDDVTVSFARAGSNNREYVNMLTAKTKNARNMSGAKQMKILAEIYAKTVIKGWSGVTDENGEEMPFTVDNCIKLLTDLPDFFTLVREEAESLENFREERQEEDLKK